ncbi:hypothetical protein N7488_004589 [Penicillium malachiteum]|nr:hypothetical protein N7488_004589 [Penicillium malachiteum]
MTPGLHMAPVSSDLEWRPVWEFWPSWGARFEGNLFKLIPVFSYMGHGWYLGNSHIPVFYLYREALIEAAMHGQVKTFQLLAAQIPWYLHEIDYYESDDGGRWYALSHLAAFYNQPAIMELLVNDGVNLMAGFPQRVLEDTPSPLHIACKDGYVEIVKVLLRQGVSPDVPDSNGVTPLILAISWGNRDIVKVLLDSGANPYQTFRSCSTLCVATGADGFDANGNLQPMIGNHTREFRDGEMREYWPESIHRTSYCTPLACAAFLDQADCARILLENGAKPNFVEPNGEMPLHIALENANLKTASILIQNGARLDMMDGPGKTAMHYALLPVGSSWEVLETLKFLIDNGTRRLQLNQCSGCWNIGTPIQAYLYHHASSQLERPSVANHRNARIVMHTGRVTKYTTMTPSTGGFTNLVVLDVIVRKWWSSFWIEVYM